MLIIPFSGYFVPPTVITGLKDSSRCMQEEIFGPVVCIAKFNGDDEGKKIQTTATNIKLIKVAKVQSGSTTYLYFLDEVTQRANDVPYGLCASVWSENAGRIHRVASKLKVSH